MKKSIQTRIFPETKLSLKTIKKQVDTLTTDPTTKLGLRVGLVTIGAGLVALALGWRKLPPEVPLLYSRPYGESQLMSAWGLWLLPGLSLVVELIAMRLAGTMIEEDKLLAQILIWSAGLMGAMALISLLKIIFLVT